MPDTDTKAPAKKAPTKKAPTKKAASKTPAKIDDKPVAKRNTRGEVAGADVTLALRARCSGFWINSQDEARTEQDLIPAIAKAGYTPIIWDIANGAYKINGEALRGDIDYNQPEDPDTLFDTILKKSQQKITRNDRNVWILRDLSPWLEGAVGAVTRRRLRNMLRPDGLSGTPRNVAQAIIVLSSGASAPDELTNGELTVIDWPLPDRDEISEILTGAIDVLPDTEDQPLKTRVLNALTKDGQRDAAIDAAVGLSSQEVQTTFARSLIEHSAIDVSAIAAEKKRLIDQEPAMTYYAPRPGGFDVVGGLENFKEWAIRAKMSYTPEARAYGLKMAKGAMLMGVSGCLAEGTRIAYKRGNRVSAGDRSLPIEVLYQKFNRIGRHSGAQWIEGIPTYTQSWDAETGRMVFNEITAVTDSGIKEVLRIATSDAGIVELTADHPLLCEDGVFREAGELTLGDKIVARGSMKPIKSEQPRIYRKRKVVEGLKYHPIAWRKVVVEPSTGKRYEYGRITNARLVVEAYMNKIELEEFIRILKEEPEVAETLVFLPAEWDVHHMDENPLNDVIGNLMVVPHDEHPRLHSDADGATPREHTVTAAITSIDKIGARHCYDVTMAEPHANFAVNDGIVVHNCGKTLSCQALGSEWNWPVIRLDINALKGKYVGESEARLRGIFTKIDALGQVIVYIDEVEKALEGAVSGSADGGVSADALGAILTWMQDRSSQAFVLMTANDPSKLPPEFMRKGRFDEVWWIDLPNPIERMDVARATLRSNGRDADALDIDLSAIADCTEGFTGAEIAAMIEHDAMFAAFSDGGREIETYDILTAASNVIPLNKTMGEKIARLRDNWAGRAKMATRPEGAGTSSGTGLTTKARVLDL